MQGSLVTAAGDKVSFKATGTFCRANQTAKYAYTITGGSGKFAGANGTGTVTIPTPATSTTDTQTWHGTLKYTVSQRHSALADLFRKVGQYSTPDW